MPDDKTKRHPQDGKRIDINDPKEVANWTVSFGVTEQELELAVAEVGTSAAKVREYLKK